MSINQEIKPLYDRLIVEVLQNTQETTTKGGILIPETSKDEATLTGKVLSVGSGYRGRDGVITPMTVNKGDIVLFAQYAGSQIRYEGKKVFLIKESDVMGIIS